jgi:uncharacterized protein
MRKSEKEIKERSEIDSIIRRSQFCRLGLSDDGKPYIVPLAFGYDGRAVYFHCAREGRKLDILAKNKSVCLEFDIVEGMVEDGQACGWGFMYQSVIAFGSARVIEDVNEKRDALAVLMAHYSKDTFTFPDDKTEITCAVKVEIKEITGKRSKRL